MSEDTATEPALPSWLIVGFTGHRDLPDREKVSRALRHALDDLARNYPCLVGISSAASGGDTLFAREMLQRKADIIIVLPFAPERFEQDFEGDPEGWEQSKALMREAIELEVLEPQELRRSVVLKHFATLQEFEAEKKRLAGLAYMEAGIRTVDRADVLIAVWNGQEGKGFGGTADAVRYARNICKPVIVIDPHTGDAVKERFRNLPKPPQPGTPCGPIDDPRGVVERYYKHLGEDADFHAPRARWFIRGALYLNLGAATVGVILPVFCDTEQHRRWQVAGSALIVTLLGLAIWMLRKRDQNYRPWLESRTKVEVCRSFLATWDIRRHGSVGHQPRPALPGLSKLFSSLRLLRCMDRSEVPPLDEVRRTYIKKRVRHQLKYFRQKYATASGWYNWRKSAMKICTAGAILCALLALCFLKSGSPSLTEKFITFFGISLPLGTTVLGLLLVADESARRVVRYNEMKDTLRHFLPALKACPTWETLARLATQIEEELLQEVLEWRAFVRHTEDVH